MSIFLHEKCATFDLTSFRSLVWRRIRRHINRAGRKDFRVGIFHGPKRKDMLPSIQNHYDVILVSYHTLAYDYRVYMEDRKKNPDQKPSKPLKFANEMSLFDITFHRIVLDEAHVIRNSKATLFKACKLLQGTRKLCITGTPFVNKPDDIHSLFSFLGAMPLAEKHVFKTFVSVSCWLLLYVTLACLHFPNVHSHILFSGENC
jgi:SNF2 family DNA or RNA helicase